MNIDLQSRRKHVKVDYSSSSVSLGSMIVMETKGESLHSPLVLLTYHFCSFWNALSSKTATKFAYGLD